MTRRYPPAHAAACRHPAFSSDLGDRVIVGHVEALRLANIRAAERGRQTVRQHVGWLFRRGVWYVQDVRPGQVTT